MISTEYDSSESSQYNVPIICEHEIEGRITFGALSLDKLMALRKDTTEKQSLMPENIAIYKKYIIMLKEAQDYAINNVLPLVEKMDEGKYNAGNMKAKDADGCSCTAGAELGTRVYGQGTFWLLLSGLHFHAIGLQNNRSNVDR